MESTAAGWHILLLARDSGIDPLVLYLLLCQLKISENAPALLVLLEKSLERAQRVDAKLKPSFGGTGSHPWTRRGGTGRFVGVPREVTQAAQHHPGTALAGILLFPTIFKPGTTHSHRQERVPAGATSSVWLQGQDWGVSTLPGDANTAGRDPSIPPGWLRTDTAASSPGWWV